MREAKFRAWRKMYKKWSYFELHKLIVEATEVGWFPSGYENWCEYTGLHGKNGEEIYEEDILRDHLHYTYRVVFHAGAFWVEPIFEPHEGYETELLSDYNVRGEIVGNHFENPELLDKI